MDLQNSSTNGTEALARQLEKHLESFGNVLVAFSGGVDSSVVLKAASNALGEKAIGILADTESNTDEDIALCHRIAGEHGMRLETITYSELAIDNYADNPINRCFFCKNELYSRLSELAAKRDIEVVCDGSNADDAGDYRPGLKAVAKHRVRSPLRELGIDKVHVRQLARYYGLPNHDRPSSPCLSSRIPYGSKVTRKKLDQVGQAEKVLREMGFSEFRCRHHGEVVRLELLPAEFPVALERREEILARLREIGFHWVALDLGGFQSGSLNRVVMSSGHRADDSA